MAQALLVAEVQISNETLGVHVRAALQGLKLHTAEVEAATRKILEAQKIPVDVAMRMTECGVHVDVMRKLPWCGPGFQFHGDAPVINQLLRAAAMGEAATLFSGDLDTLLKRGNAFYVHIQPTHFCISFFDDTVQTIPLGFIYGTPGSCVALDTGRGKGKWCMGPLDLE